VVLVVRTEVGVGEELADGGDGGAVELVVPAAEAEAVKCWLEFAGDLNGWSGQGTAGMDDHDVGAGLV